MELIYKDFKTKKEQQQQQQHFLGEFKSRFLKDFTPLYSTLIQTYAKNKKEKNVMV